MARPVSRKVKKDTGDVLYHCAGGCGLAKPITAFYKNSNKLFKSKIVPWCKDCTKLAVYAGAMTPDVEKLKEYLRAVNLPFLSDVWGRTITKKREPIGGYISILTFNPVTRDLCWADSCFGYMENTDKDVPFKKKRSKPVSDMLKKKWQTDNTDDIEFLEEQYHEWATSREIDDKAIGDLVKQICYTNLELKDARKTGDHKLVNDKTKLLQDLMGSANLKPVQDIGNTNNEHVTFGTILQKIEFTRPIDEYMSDQSQRELSRDFVGQLARMEGLTGPVVTEYLESLKEHSVEEFVDEYGEE